MPKFLDLSGAATLRLSRHWQDRNKTIGSSALVEPAFRARRRTAKIV